jgi:hypothetical protein
MTDRVAVRRRAVYSRLADGDGIIVDIESAFYYGLNRSASFLWQEIQSHPDGVTRPELTRSLCHRFRVTPDDAARDIEDFVKRLASRELVTVSASTPGAAQP